MYQYSVQVQNPDNGFVHALDDLKRRLSSAPADRILFHIYSAVFSVQMMSDLIAALRERFAGCRITCCTVSGSAFEYAYQPGIIIAATVFEHESSRAEARAYDTTASSDREAASEIVRFVRENPWVKAVEIYRTAGNMNTSDFCDAISALPEDIIVYGGLVCTEQIGVGPSYVADQSGQLMDDAVLAVYYGGEDLHIQTYKMSGWKPIDMPFTVTKSVNNVIKELDNAPAHEIYKRYLDINPDENFVINVLEFPLLSQDGGHSVVRNVFALDPEGGFVVAYDVNVGTKLKICYADAESVVEDINSVSRQLMQFTPDVISIVSCITRSIIWRMKDYMPELHGFKSVAPCHGYLSHGELIREDGVFNHHNTILIAAAFREGGLKNVYYPEVSLGEGATIPLAARLSTFISRVTSELKNTYSRVEQVATTDALTGIGNRYLFDTAADAAALDAAHANTKYLVMFDMNGLKFVNDTFGHSEGDAFIKAASMLIANTFSPYGQCFRIGGDEFAVIADFESEAAMRGAIAAFNESSVEYNRTAPHVLSMAVGYAALMNAEGKLLTCSEWKSTADINMYRNKAKFHPTQPRMFNQAMSEFILCLMSLIDNKEPVYAYHAVRVQRMVARIAELMHLDSDVSERASLGGYLHDIGKIGITDSIVVREGETIVTKEERASLRWKPVIGRRLLMASEETKEVADIVYACYERWDGKGYPNGLAGEDIPIESRLIAVANYIDTMIRNGYDRTASTPEECIRELQNRSGTMYDPAVISVVVENFDDIIKVSTTDWTA